MTAAERASRFEDAEVRVDLIASLSLLPDSYSPSEPIEALAEELEEVIGDCELDELRWMIGEVEEDDAPSELMAAGYHGFFVRASRPVRTGWGVTRQRWFYAAETLDDALVQVIAWGEERVKAERS